MSAATASPARPAPVAPDALATVVAGRRARGRRRLWRTVALAALVVAAFATTLMVGNTFYGPDAVIRVILGQQVPGASFTVGELRLPRASLGVLAGFAFGVAGVTFQTMLRNPLASPDIIGITWGASAAAVVGIVVLSLGDTGVSVLALAGALVTALAVYLLAYRRGFSGARLILIGIGVAAMLESVVSWVLSRASEWDMPAAMQWLAGSLNGADWDGIAPLAWASLVLVPVMFVLSRELGPLRLGDDSAAALGVRVQFVRLALILGAVALLAFATAAAGPISFVAFMAGPIAGRLLGPGAPLLLPAGLVGALLVLVADLVGQFAFDARYPVGVVTGALGAPFLIYLLARTSRRGGTL
ncbi:FecCD family ABC transporter permease [Protaetiibacter intestinalis]|uniref:Iron ABC transporter permease n=1 Tax=Protaetiibacter intestinalis TaxID=2419774 RepID=A0A387BES4_9MICO|nr:iron chelate uptake ABC transporter family permease subunit [Protaetiibacter intestinalis]AYF96980.1 iron ABC transporter permease [Protaetiibacter intestinalis]